MDYTQAVLQQLHTQLQNSMIALPADKKADCLAALQFPGLPIDPSEYGENGLSESLQNLLDTGVNMQAAYQPVGSSLFRFFGDILQNAQLPPGKDLTQEEKTQLRIAETYISKNCETYQKYYDKYLEAQQTLASAKGSVARRSAQAAMKKISQEWSAHGRQKYEEHSNVIRELHTSSPASYFISARDNYELYPYADLLLTPAGWHSSENLSWTSMELEADAAASSAHSETTSTSKKIQEFYRSPGIWSTICGWFGVRKGVTVTKDIQEVIQKANTEFSSSHMKMSWEMMPVSVQRPWLDLNVLAVKGAKMSGIPRGGYSTGELSANNKGTFPGYITAFIVAKNAEMTMTLSKELSESLKKNSSSITCGPLSGAKETNVNIVENSDNSKKDTSDVTISTGSGKQIIGYIVRPFPCFPTA